MVESGVAPFLQPETIVGAARRRAEMPLALHWIKRLGLGAKGETGLAFFTLLADPVGLLSSST